MNKAEYIDSIHCLSGKTVAVVYIFEGEDSDGYGHYDIWRSDVISEWLLAIQQLKCRPLIMDIRTFIHKAMSGTLPHIDYVLNLNAGAEELSTLALVPSVCGFLGVPCLPCNSVAIVAGEHKVLANFAAECNQLNIPSRFSEGKHSVSIFRPTNFGSSRGVAVEKNATKANEKGITQEFVQGYDITTPILYNPIEDELQVLPSIMYYPESKDINWFLSEEAKEVRGGYLKEVVCVDEKTQSQFIEMSKAIEINCYSRIDSRIYCSTSDEWSALIANTIPAEKVYFIEINPMPTLKENINFHNSIDALTPGHKMYECYSYFKELRSDASPTAFILSCSMLANHTQTLKKKGFKP